MATKGSTRSLTSSLLWKINLRFSRSATSIRTFEHLDQPYRPTRIAPKYHFSNLQVLLLASALGTNIVPLDQESRCFLGKLFRK